MGLLISTTNVVDLMKQELYSNDINCINYE